MDKKVWTKTIKEQCQSAGTYKESLDPVIDTLASILEKRDAAEKEYKKNGSKPIIERHTERGDHINMVKNPALQIIIDLNAQALTYWREMGLTPAGLKKLNADALTAKATEDGFEKLLAKIAR